MFLVLVFLFKRRWQALAGLLVAGLVVVLGSLAVAGPGGMRAYQATLRPMSGFRDVPRIVSPTLMINWRGVLAGILPEEVSEGTGLGLTLALSAATTATLAVIWRGPWSAGSDRFAFQMLATGIVMMLASFHNHIHSAALLLVPGMAVAAAKSRPPMLTTVLLAGLYGPLPLFFATASTRFTAWLIVAVMLAALGVVVAAELSSPRAAERLPSAQAAPCGLDAGRSEGASCLSVIAV